MRKDQTMKAILHAIQAKEAEMARLSIEIGALREVYNKEAGIKIERPRAARSNVKSSVLDFLKQVGSNGLNAQIAVDMAKERGEGMQIKSASSLLSRLKADGVVVHVGNLYVLKEFAPRQPAALQVEVGSSNVVRPIRTSGTIT